MAVSLKSYLNCILIGIKLLYDSSSIISPPTVISFYLNSAPAGCLQYYTGVTNVFTSFNWDGRGNGVIGRQLANQNYRICFRQEEGNHYLSNNTNHMQ